MKTGTEGKPSREFQIRWTERIYHLQPHGITNHAPPGPGVFEIVLFPPGAQDGEVLYVGFEPVQGSVFARLEAILENRGGLEPENLKVVQENLSIAYFDTAAVADVETDEDLMDLAWAVVAAKKSRLNDLAKQPHSGKYSEITYKEV